MSKPTENITRRDAVKKMGTTAAAAAITLSGVPTTEAHAAAPANDKQTPRVLLLNGSARRDGNTFTLLSEIKTQLKKHNVEGEIFQLGNLPVRGCIDCGQCQAKRLGKCVFDNDVVNQIISKMATCDAIIVGSPVYYGMPAGQVLAALQRMAYSAGGVLQGKPAAVVTVCRRGGATAAFQALQMPFQMLNMPIVTSQYWNIAYGANKGEVQKDLEGMQTMRVLADNMAYMLRQFATGTAPRPKREGKTNTNFIR